MNSFKRCPECGRDMTWGMKYNCGSIVVFWKCFCGYFEDGKCCNEYFEKRVRDTRILNIT